MRRSLPFSTCRDPIIVGGIFVFIAICLLPVGCSTHRPSEAASAPSPKVKVMLLTGQSSKYHNWQVSSVVLQRHLEESGRFVVDRVVSPPTGADMSGFRPAFENYDVIVVDYEGDDWPEQTQRAFEKYMRRGGGLVTFHATDNAFPHWKEWNLMIGVGGWGARDETWGPKVRWREGRVVLDHSPGTAMHPPSHDFLIETRAPDHPTMKGLPERWLHAHDELYCQLRGPAKNLTVLATAFADPARFPKVSGEHEPVLLDITYERGRVFHLTLGHVGPNSVEPVRCLQCVGFITVLQRGTEWAGTGRVTLPVPPDFPTAERTSIRQ